MKDDDRVGKPPDPDQQPKEPEAAAETPCERSLAFFVDEASLPRSEPAPPVIKTFEGIPRAGPLILAANVAGPEERHTALLFHDAMPEELAKGGDACGFTLLVYLGRRKEHNERLNQAIQRELAAIAAEERQRQRLVS